MTKFPRPLMRNKTMGHWQLANCSLPVDMLGGFMTNAGLGNVKMSLPIAWTTAMLSWGLITYDRQFEKVGFGKVATAWG